MMARPLATTPLGRFWNEFRANRVAVLALLVLTAILFLAIFANWIAPQNPYDAAEFFYKDTRRPPGYVGAGGYSYLLGTDGQGRDVFSLILYGLRISLEISLVAGALSLVVGAIFGVLAAFVGGWVEALIMRIVDLQLSFPAILMALVIAAVLGQGQVSLTIAITVSQYAYFARAAHGAAVAERHKDYVEAAQATPLPQWRIIFRHILPNSMPPLVVIAVVQIASAISLEATLSFLGLGLPENTPSLGAVIANGFQFMYSGRYWISIYPGVALMILIIAVNLVGDQIRDQLNPRLKR